VWLDTVPTLYWQDAGEGLSGREQNRIRLFAPTIIVAIARIVVSSVIIRSIIISRVLAVSCLITVRVGRFLVNVVALRV
jgi:hypothetical protein